MFDIYHPQENHNIKVCVLLEGKVKSGQPPGWSEGSTLINP